MANNVESSISSNLEERSRVRGSIASTDTIVDNITASAKRVDLEKTQVPAPAPKGFFAKFKKSDDEKKKPDPAVPFFSLWKFASPLDRLMIVLGSLASIVLGGLVPSSILILGQFLSNSTSLVGEGAAGGVDINKFVPTILTFVYFGIAMLVAGYLSQCLWVLAGENQTKRIRELYVHSILRQDMGWFDKAEEGSLTTRLAQDTQLIQDGISEKAGQALQSIAQFVTGFVIAFVKGWELALVLLASLPVLGIVGSAMVFVITKFVGKGQDAYADAGAVAEQVISGIRTVYSFSLQERFQKMYEVELQKAYLSDIRKGQALGLGFGSFMLVIFCTYGLAFWYGSRLVIQDEMDGSKVLIVFISMLMGAMALINLPPNIAAIGNARGAAHKIFNTIDRVPQIDSFSTEGLKPEKVVGSIEFRNVKFAYPSRPDVTILESLSLDIRPGSTIAFVGPSGSGKSTSVSLMQRFYDPLEGAVYLDGKDLKSYNVQWLRQHIGVVSQEPVLFNTTIKQNVLMGAVDDVNENDLIEACKRANCHNFISKLPKGYETLVGEHGGMLSGGQKQRIAIARALIKNPQILLLDEATSALDTQSERMVQRALDAAAEDRTTIVIAHRLSTIKNADLICVMASGNLVEKGNHEELIALRGVYYELVEKQRIKMEVEKHIEGAHSDNPLINEKIDDVELDKLLEAETVDIVRRVKEENTDEVIETRLILDDTAALKSAVQEKHRLEKADKKRLLEQSAPVKRVIMLMRPEWPLLAIGCIGAAVAGCVFPVFALIFTEVIVVLMNPDKSEISPGAFQGANLYAFIFCMVGVTAFLSIFTQVFFFEKAGARMSRRLRAMAFKALIRQEVGFFDEEGHGLGALTSRLATEASKVCELVTKVSGDLVQLITTLICGLAIAFSSSYLLTFIVLAIVPFIAAGTAYESRIHRGFEDSTKKAYEESGEIAAEAIKEIRTVASLTRESYFEDRFSANIERPHQLAHRKAYFASIGYGATQGFNQFANAIGFYAGLRLIESGLTFQHMFTVVMAVMLTASGLGRSSTFVSTFSRAKFAAINTFELIDRETLIDPDLPGEIPDNLEGDFNFENIEFTYPARPDQPIFTGKFNLEGKKNQTIALVGPSGCGKSTTIGMIQRWYDASGGKVSVDGKDVRGYQLKEGLRKYMAIVSQEPVLFDMSVRENILAGTDRTDVTDKELDEIAQMANIFTFVQQLPNGYDTRVGDKGGQLSGGQKQRVAIARALIRNPKFLLLDEATSALDSESEKVVQDALDKAIEAGGRTTITIAHRLSTIQNADMIAVVKDGRVVELGTHFELLALNGVYTGLVKQQDLNALA